MTVPPPKLLDLPLSLHAFSTTLFWLGTRVSKGWDVPLSLCPGTKIFSCPVVPLSCDKVRSKNLGTNSSVPRRLGTKSLSKKIIKQEKDFLKQEKDVLKHEEDKLKQEKMF